MSTRIPLTDSEAQSSTLSFRSESTQRDLAEDSLEQSIPRTSTEIKMASPTPHRTGQPLFLSNPPLRTISCAKGSIQFIDPENRRGNISSGRLGLTPPSLSSKLSVAQTIRFDRLGGLIPEEQIVELHRLVSFHGLQKQKLATVGSYLTTLCDETFSLRELAASLTGRVD